MVFVTGDVLTPETATFLAETSLPVIEKPIDPYDLRLKVRAYLGAAARSGAAGQRGVTAPRSRGWPETPGPCDRTPAGSSGFSSTRTPVSVRKPVMSPPKVSPVMNTRRANSSGRCAASSR